MWYYDGRIRIKPDWNVNILSKNYIIFHNSIRIKPDWNVNLHSDLANTEKAAH